MIKDMNPNYTQWNSLYSGHHWDPAVCFLYEGVADSVVVLYTALASWDSRRDLCSNIRMECAQTPYHWVSEADKPHTPHSAMIAGAT